MKPFSLVYRQLSSDCDLTWPFLSVYTLLVPLCLLIKTPVLLNQSLPLMTSFNINYLLRDDVSNIVRLGVRASNRKFMGL